MKSVFLKCTSIVAALLFLFFAPTQAQVKIGSAGTPNSNAVLELDGGTNKGLLLPRLSNTQITALTTAPDGMIVYNTTDGSLYLRKSASWQKISDATTPGGGSFALPYSGTTAAAGPALSITSTNNGGDAIRGFGNSGNGISAFSNSGAGGYFASASGPALMTAIGPVGINTTEPAFPLDINGRTRIRSNGAFNSAGIWYDKMYTAGLSSFVGTMNDSSFGIYGGGDWKFTFDHINNRLGINQSNPKAPLSFSNATGNKLDIYYGSDNSRYGIGLQGGLMQLYTGTATDDIVFGYGSSTVFTERVRIRGNGDVGIGTGSPAGKLDIRQSSSSQALNVTQEGTGIGVFAQNSGAGTTIYAANLGTGAAIATYGKVGINNSDPSFYLDVAGRMRLRNESPSNGAGLWLDGSRTERAGFIGMYNNEQMGFFGSGATDNNQPATPQWGLLYNTRKGNVSVNYGLRIKGGVSTKYILLKGSGVLNLNYITLGLDEGAAATYSFHFVSPTGIGDIFELQLPAASSCEGQIYCISSEIKKYPSNGTGQFSRLYVTSQFKDVLVYPNITHDYVGSFSDYTGLMNYAAVLGGTATYHYRKSVIVQSMFDASTSTYFWAVISSDFWDQTF